MLYFVFGVVVLLCTVIVVYRRFSQRYVSVDIYEYLDLLSLHRWKEADEIRKEMEKKKGGDVSIPRFYAAMSQLEMDGLVESRLNEASTPEKQKARGFARIKEFKLNEDGRRKRLELQDVVTSDRGGFKFA